MSDRFSYLIVGLKVVPNERCEGGRLVGQILIPRGEPGVGIIIRVFPPELQDDRFLVRWADAEDGLARLMWMKGKEIVPAEANARNSYYVEGYYTDARIDHG